MTELWAHVRADQAAVSLTKVVGGISLALRHARTAQRIGLAGLRFVIADEPERERVRALFVKHLAPEGLVLEFAGEEAATGHAHALALEGNAIYLRDTLAAALEAHEVVPTPDFTLKNANDVTAATRFLYRQIRKSIALDGIIAYYLMRPLARVFTRMLLNTPVSPNQATLFALACGLAAALSAAMGGATFAIFAGIFYWSGGVLDCIDGELARLRLQSSKIGEWLDSMVDEFSTIALLIGLGIGLSRDGYGQHWLVLGFAGALLGIASLAPMYIHLHRKGLAIDTAQFPWFFGNANAANDQGSGLFGKLITFMGYFIRRDANITGTSVLLILNLRSVAISIILVAYLVASVLVATHYTVVAARHRAT